MLVFKRGIGYIRSLTAASCYLSAAYGVLPCVRSTA